MNKILTLVPDFAYSKSLLSYVFIGWGAISECLKEVHKIQKWIIKIIYHRPIWYPADLLYRYHQIKGIRELYSHKNV